MKRKNPPRVNKKTKILIREGEDPKQAYATAMSMEKKHRLTKSGGYRRVGRKKRK